MVSLAIDNVLWHGAVIKPEDESESTRAIRDLNDHLTRRKDIDIRFLTHRSPSLPAF